MYQVCTYIIYVKYLCEVFRYRIILISSIVSCETPHPNPAKFYGFCSNVKYPSGAYLIEFFPKCTGTNDKGFTYITIYELKSNRVLYSSQYPDPYDSSPRPSWPRVLLFSDIGIYSQVKTDDQIAECGIKFVIVDGSGIYRYKCI